MATVLGSDVHVDDAQREAGYSRSACTECQRRKQKCNREWPCDRCQRRKIADECRYNYSNPSLEAPVHDLKEKLKRTHDDYANRGTLETEEAGAGFDALASRLYATLGIDHGVSEKPMPKQDYVDEDSSPQMQRVLKLLPQRQSMDILMQNFLTDINYHYYIIYPPVFLQDYHIWWDRRLQKRPLSLQYTCLLAIITSCCFQHLEPASEREFEAEMGDTIDAASDQLHAAMRELASVIPVGHYHYLNVQRLLHSCYWYKAEAKFLEAWHVLSAAILEAKELGYHKDPPAGTVSEFDLEMRRRLWCILDTWDWQISSGLSRPKIIDRDDCDAELPKLTLEGHIVSPLLHMKLQSGLTRKLAARFSAPKNIIEPAEVQEYKVLIEDWVRQFPPEYSFDHPDTSKDEACSWLFAHRYYVYTMACLLILNPIRHYMVKSYTWDSPPEELEIRRIGVWYSVKLMRTMHSWVDKVNSRDGRLHFIIFSIFDTAAILCTGIIKDTEYTLPNRPEILDSIDDAVDLLKKLNTISKTSKVSYDILERLVRRLPDSVSRKNAERQLKRPKVKPASPYVDESASLGAQVSPTSVPPPGTTTEPPPQLPGPQQQSPVPVQAALLAPAIDATQAPVSDPIPAEVPHGVTRPGQLPATTQQSMPQAVGMHPVLDYSHHPNVGYTQPPVTQNAYLDINSQSASISSGVGHFAEEAQGWSTGSETTPPSMDGHLMSSFSTVNEPVGMDGMPQNLNGGGFQPQILQPQQDFNLEDITQAQLGELAPLWNWHSENLDIGSMPAPEPPPNNSYTGAM